jgi:Right handed beta helix region/Protein of unknown function (DUF1565)
VISPNRSSSWLRRVLTALGAALLSLLLVAPAQSVAGSRTKFVSTSGSDRNPGTKAAPWRTIGKAIRAARPGIRIVIKPGHYGARGRTIEVDASGTRASPITFTGQAHKRRPKILGYFEITGHDLRFGRLRFIGPTGRIKPITPENPKGEQVQVAIRGGDRVWITRSEVSDSDWHAGIYVHRSNRVRITRNYVHDNGDDTQQSQENSSHGIYFESGSGLVANNVIEHNLARGVQLYPRPHHVVVKENTIVRNRQTGVQVSKYAARNKIANNIVAYNADYSIRSYRLTGKGNSVIRNIVWGSGQPWPNSTEGLIVRGNLTADPFFVGPTDYHLTADSPAIDRANPFFTVEEDFDGLPRPQRAAFDIGAFEAP